MNNFNQNNNYNQTPYGYRDGNPYNMPKKEPIWAAVTSFAVSIANLVFCCCTTYVAVPVSIVFGIVSLVKKWRGKGLAVAGIIISVVTLVFTVVSEILMRDVSDDITKFMISADQYVEEYQETGEIPQEFAKYSAPEYDSYWKAMGYDDFEEFYSDFMESFSRWYGVTGNSDYTDNESEAGDSHNGKQFGETPVDI